MLDAMVIGNVGVDTQVYLPSGFDWNAPTRVEGFFTHNVDTIGQAGGYSSFGYARLGYRTAFVGAIGDDPLGRWIAEAMAEAGVERHVFTDPAGTSRSVNLMRGDGRRNNFYDGGSHMTLEPELSGVEALLRINDTLEVVVGCGAQGAVWGTATDYVEWPAVELSEPVVDSNGAGDSLAVGFSSARILDGLSVDTAIARGQLAARYCCAIDRGAPFVITRAELESRLESSRPFSGRT